MTRTKRSFAILLVIVCLLANMFSFAALAEDSSGAEGSLGEGTIAASTWKVTVAKSSFVLGLRTGVNTAQIAPSAINNQDNAVLENLTGVTSKGTYKVFYESSDEGIATVDSIGRLTAQNTGTSFITVSVINTADYTKAVTRVMAEVSTDITDFELVNPNPQIAPRGTFQIKTMNVAGDYGKIAEFTYASKNQSVARVDAAGLITVQPAASKGATAVIDVTAKIYAPDGSFTPATKSLTVTVVEPAYDEYIPIASDPMLVLSDDPDSAPIEAGTKVNLSGPSAIDGFTTGWVRDLDISQKEGETEAQWKTRVQLHDRNIYQAEYYGGTDPNFSNAIGMALIRDSVAAEGYSTQSAYRQFADENEFGVHKIDFDQDGKVYYVQFMMFHQDGYGSTWSKVDFGGKFSVLKWIQGGSLAYAKMFADFGSAITSSNTDAKITSYKRDAYTLVCAKIITSSTGEDQAYFKFFGPQETTDTGNSARAVLTPTFDPASWDYSLKSYISGTADYLGVSSNTYQKGQRSTFSKFNVWEGEYVSTTDIEVPTQKVDLEVGQSYQATVEYMPSNATVKSASWTTSDSAVASVAADGTITARAPGSATITATSPNAVGAKKSDTITVNVNQTISKLDLTASNNHVKIADTASLLLTGTKAYDGAAVVALSGVNYTSSDASAIAVSGGKLTGKQRGLSQITVGYNNMALHAAPATAGIVAFVPGGYKLEKSFDGTTSVFKDRKGTVNSVLAADGQTHEYAATEPLTVGIAEAWFYDDGLNMNDLNVALNGTNASDSISAGIDAATSTEYYTINVNGTKEVTNIKRSIGWKQMAVDRSAEDSTIVYLAGEKIKTIDGTHTGLNKITASSAFQNPAGGAAGPAGYFDDFYIMSVEGNDPTILGEPTIIDDSVSGMLSVSYAYFDADGDPEAGSTFTWYAKAANGALTYVGTGVYPSKSIPREQFKGSTAVVNVLVKDATGAVAPAPKTANKEIPGGSTGVPPITGPGPTITPMPTLPPVAPFTDIAGHWAEQDILYLKSVNLIDGYTDKTFKPDNSITRAEFIKTIAVALGLESVDYAGGYSDVFAGDWYAPYIQAATNAGLVSGSDGVMRPNDLITREEMAKVVVEAYKHKKGAEAPAGSLSFTDEDSISDWAKTYVASANELGLIRGMEDGAFSPKTNATRAQTASIIRRLVGLF